MKRVIAAFASLGLLAWIAFHVMVIGLLVQSEVIPALAAGSFNIQTKTMILNRVWEGNELYWLLAAHATLVLILTVVCVRTTRFAIRGSRRLHAPASSTVERAAAEPGC